MTDAAQSNTHARGPVGPPDPPIDALPYLSSLSSEGKAAQLDALKAVVEVVREWAVNESANPHGAPFNVGYRSAQRYVRDLLRNRGAL